MSHPRYITNIEQVTQLSEDTRSSLKKVCDRFPFRSNEYYLSLIDWNDPCDPIRRIIIPSDEELIDYGTLDASNEKQYTMAPGLEHKYEYIAVLLVNEVCGGFCRYCFRKRLFMEGGSDEVARDVSAGVEYIRNHPEITNVLLTGGDPLLLSTRKLRSLIENFYSMDHIKIIRIGSKIPSFNPYRILNDPSLLDLFRNTIRSGKQLYLMVHFNHPNELTKVAIEAVGLIRETGVVVMNQTPLIKGVNDDPRTLADLFNQLTFSGVIPYYVFQCRPTLGNRHMAVPVERGYEIHEQAKMNVAGIAKISRFVMSHILGKIQVLGLTEDSVYLKFHRSADPSKKAKILICRRNPEAYWFDDYTEVIDEYCHENPFYHPHRDEALTSLY